MGHFLLTRGGERSLRILLAGAGLALTVLAGTGVFAPAALAFSPPQIYWANTDSGAIGKANLDGASVNQSFITTGAQPFGLNGVAVDGRHIYWINGQNVGEANLDGTNVNPQLITGLRSPQGLAVNGQHIYWASDQNIGEANLDGTNVNQGLISTTGTSFGWQGLAVDGQHIYWANAGAIGEANLDGTGQNDDFITTGSSQSFMGGVAVDGQHVYWGTGSTIGEANLDGTDVNRSFITTSAQVNGVAVDDQHVYWANGSTIGVANVDGTFVNQSFVTAPSSARLFGLAVSVPVARVTPDSPPPFASTPQRSLSAPLMLTLANAGQRAMSITGLSFTGPDAGDFIVGSNGCLGSVAPGESCQVTVSFAPQGQGARTATLLIASTDYANSPLRVPLSGTGGSVLTGTPGPAGKVELLICKTRANTVIRKHDGKLRRVRIRERRCTGRVVSGTAKFPTSRADRATLSRGSTVYATGASVSTGHGRSELQLKVLRPLRAGRYTLTLRNRHSPHRVLERQTITLH